MVSKPTWGKDQPNNYNGEQNCVVLDGGRSWLWNDVGCNLDYLHWICQYRECRMSTRYISMSLLLYARRIMAMVSLTMTMHHTQLLLLARCRDTGFLSTREWDVILPLFRCGLLYVKHGSIIEKSLAVLYLFSFCQLFKTDVAPDAKR